VSSLKGLFLGKVHAKKLRFMEFIEYLKAVATGHKRNRDLKSSEVLEALSLIAEGHVPLEQIGAFFAGLRLKGESIEEMQGILQFYDHFTQKLDLVNSIELGYPSDGKNDNPYLFTLFSKYLEPMGVELALLIDDIKHAKVGITTKEITQTIQTTTNLHIINRQNIAPKISALNTIRENLAIRTSLNAVEKLTAFAQSKMGIIGVFHRPYVAKYQALYGDRYEKMAIVQGNEGSFEIFGKCTAWVKKGGDFEQITIDPKEFGIEYQKNWHKISFENMIAQINEPSDDLLQIAKLNAAFLLFVYEDEITTIKEAFETLGERV
jgi:anthranilate phosphoribosyltransferase